MVLVCLCLFAQSCGSGGQSPGQRGELAGITINFAIKVDDHEQAAIRELLSRFEKDTKVGIKLELLSRFRDQRGAKANLVEVRSEDLASRLEGAGPPIHLFAQDNVALGELVSKGLVQDLSDQVAVPSEVIPAMVPPKFENKQYFLPFWPNVRLAYAHRPPLLTAGVRAPRTVEELADVARRLKQQAGKPMVTLSLSSEEGGTAAAVTISEWILSHGGDPRLLNDEGSVKGFESLQRMWREGLISRESLFAKHDTEVDLLMEHRSWLAQNWSGTSASLANSGLLQDFEVYAGWQGRDAHVIGGGVLGMPRSVEGKERLAAMALARFLMSREAQELLVRRNAWPAIREDAYGTLPGGQEETFGAVREALRGGWYRPSEPYWSDVTEQMNVAVDRILLRSEPVRPVLDELHLEVKAKAGPQYPPSH